MTGYIIATNDSPKAKGGPVTEAAEDRTRVDPSSIVMPPDPPIHPDEELAQRVANGQALIKQRAHARAAAWVDVQARRDAAAERNARLDREDFVIQAEELASRKLTPGFDPLALLREIGAALERAVTRGWNTHAETQNAVRTLSRRALAVAVVGSKAAGGDYRAWQLDALSALGHERTYHAWSRLAQGAPHVDEATSEFPDLAVLLAAT